MEYRSAQPKKTVAAPTIRPRARWSPPPAGWFKANFDAAIFQDVGRASLGVILRDSQGLAMVSLARIYSLLTPWQRWKPWQQHGLKNLLQNLALIGLFFKAIPPQSSQAS